MHSYYICFWNEKSLKWMILKEKTTFVLKQKVHKIFLHIVSFQNILSIFFIFWKKSCIFYWRGIDPPPPLADAKNASFFEVLPKPICTTTESFEINAFHSSLIYSNWLKFWGFKTIWPCVCNMRDLDFGKILCLCLCLWGLQFCSYTFEAKSWALCLLIHYRIRRYTIIRLLKEVFSIFEG